ncbi:hypothetical protein D3C83_99690 [compost metagenome]
MRVCSSSRTDCSRAVSARRLSRDCFTRRSASRRSAISRISSMLLLYIVRNTATFDFSTSGTTGFTM